MTSYGAKFVRILHNKMNGLIRDYGIIKYLVFGCEKYGLIF